MTGDNVLDSNQEKKVVLNPSDLDKIQDLETDKDLEQSSKRYGNLSEKLTPLNKEDVDRQLDFRELKLASKEAEFKTFNDVDADGHSSDDDASKNDVSCFKRNRRKKSDFDPAPKMNTFVGFLRLANYVNACCVIFGVILSIFLHDLDLEENDLDREKRNFETLSNNRRNLESWRYFVYVASGWLQVAYLCVVAIVTMIDAIATVTFRWKEYGELTHSQSDATSFIFFLCKSRWMWRLGCGLVLSSSVSLSVTTAMKMASRRDNFESVPFEPIWFVALSTVSVASTVIGYCFRYSAIKNYLCDGYISLFPWHGVCWLYDKFQVCHIEDKGDVWKKTWGKQFRINHDGGSHKQKPEIDEDDSLFAGFSPLLNVFVDVLSIVSFFSSYLFGLGIHVFCILVMPKNSLDDIEMWTVIVSAASCIIIDLIALTFLTIQLIRISGKCFTERQCNFRFRLPFAAKFFAPFTLTCAVRLMMDMTKVEFDDYLPKVEDAKIFASYLWLHLVCLMLMVEIIRVSAYLNPFASTSKFCSGFWQFVVKNVKEEGVNKKAVRFFDTLGSLMALTGMILGFASLFIDQYDLNFSPEGIAQEVVDVTRNFEIAVKPITTTLKTIIDAMDRRFSCEDVFKALGTTTAVALFASFFPGAGSVANVGAKSAYYGVRAANALTNLAQKLRKSSTILWRVVSAVIKVNRFVANHLKKIIIASNTTSLAKLLPFLPPVVIGLYVMFGCFWPKRMLFFSAKQRRKTMAGLFYTWILAIFIQIIAVVINTALVDELVNLLDENIPLAKVTLNRKLGWNISMAATAFALAGTFSLCIATLILKIQTFKDHENITNEELDWKAELEKRELVTIKTAIGDKIEKRTQIKYKKERIGPWTWILPILICLIACGFGTMANFYPKMEMRREPKGTFGRLVDRIYRQISVYEDDMFRVRNDTSMECLPYPTFDDVFASNNILSKPVERFYNETQKVVNPLKTVLSGLRRQLILDVEEELFGGSLDSFWEQHQLQYIGLIFLAPRVICLLILIFGMLTSSFFVCQMRIIQSIEPRKIVDAFGKVAIFSIIYVVGAQMTIFNMLSSFGVPFYHIYIRFGLGFIYDLVADCIMLSVYVGMNNEFFFAIPKRKTIVTYSVPGVSDDGPNVPGQII